MENIQYSSTPTLHYSSFYKKIYSFSPAIQAGHGLFWKLMILYIFCLIPCETSWVNLNTLMARSVFNEPAPQLGVIRD